MGEALLTGLITGGWAAPRELAVAEKVDSRRSDLEVLFPGVSVVADPVACEGAVIAVKPGDVSGACAALGAVGVERVLSIAAGVTIAAIESALGGGVPVVRAMPNTPALVGEGAAAMAGGRYASEADMDWAASILGSVGRVVTVDEGSLDAVTGLSGSGPAYVFMVAESLIEAGVLVGLPRDVSEALAIQTLVGSAKLLAQSGEPAAALRAAVTSPGGTTAAGLAELERAGMRAAILDAVRMATQRSRELGTR